MDRNQAKVASYSYLNDFQYLPKAKEELEEIKKLTNSEERSKRALISYNYHCAYYKLPAIYYQKYNLKGEIDYNDITEYEVTVDELRSIALNKNVTFDHDKRKNDEYTCKNCQKIHYGRYWHLTSNGKRLIAMGGNDNKFCSQVCINLWRQKNLVEINDSEAPCHECQTPLSNQPWTAYDERKKITHKFCSQSCCDSFCNQYNQVVIAWNSLIMERKNLKVPNFPTWEELEVKQVSGELENYVEEVKKMISKAKENQIVEDGDEIKDETVSPINSNIEVPSYKDKVDDDTKRERENSDQTATITHNYSASRTKS